jgi:hypothetical protein
VANLFERLSRNRPPAAPLEEKDQKRRDEEALIHAQRLLDWLQKWEKDIISLRDICVFGPYVLQNERDDALNAAEILERHGWLVAQKAHRHDRREWQVLRKPIIRPTLARARL